MKHFQFFLSVIAVFIYILSASPAASAKAKFHIVVSTKYKDEQCKVEGGWCFNMGVWGDRVIQPLGTDKTFPDGRRATVYLSDDGGHLLCEFTDRENPYTLPFLDAQSDLIVPDWLAEGLGYRTLTILKGFYEVDYSLNRNGTIRFRISGR